MQFLTEDFSSHEIVNDLLLFQFRNHFHPSKEQVIYYSRSLLLDQI